MEERLTGGAWRPGVHHRRQGGRQSGCDESRPHLTDVDTGRTTEAVVNVRARGRERPVRDVGYAYPNVRERTHLVHAIERTQLVRAEIERSPSQQDDGDDAGEVAAAPQTRGHEPTIAQARPGGAPLQTPTPVHPQPSQA